MKTKRKIEIFSAGCPVCNEAVEKIKNMSCPSCEIVFLDMHDAEAAKRAKDLDVRSVPAVAINGKLADCCAGRGIDVATLQKAGLGEPVTSCG